MKKLLLLISVLFFNNKELLAQTILGIDVNNKGTINWQQVYSDGKSFAWVKATEGVTFNDAAFSTYIQNGKNAGVVMGAYHFARPDNNSALADANHFLSVAGPYIGTGYLPPVLDLENPFNPSTGQIIADLQQLFSSTALTAWVQTWMTTVQNSTGVAPIIYINSSFAAYLNSSLNTYKLWIAKPDGSSTTPPTGLGNWTTWAFKQYSWTGTVSGISGQVDLNVFNGNATAFSNLIGVNSCIAPGNDNCLNASAITSNGTSMSGTIACANGSYGANLCSGCSCTSQDDKDVYYSFTAQATSHTVVVSNYSSNFDAVIELLAGTKGEA